MSRIATGGTIAHGCNGTPTIVSVFPTEGLATDVYATVDGTNITVTFTGGGTKAFYWEVKVR